MSYNSHAQVILDPISPRDCRECGTMASVLFPENPICFSESAIVAHFHTATDPNQEVLVRVYLDFDPVPIAAQQLLLGQSLIVPIVVLGNYTVVVNCYQVPVLRDENTKNSRTDDNIPLGQCTYKKNYTSGTENPLNPEFSINDFLSYEDIMSALSFREFLSLDWEFGSWINDMLCNDPLTSHRFYLERLSETGSFISLLESSGWITGCPTQSADPGFSSQSYENFIQNEIIQFRVEVNHQGCINSEQLRFRYLGKNGDNGLKLQMIRHASTSKGDEFNHADFPGSGNMNRAEKYVIQDCDDEDMPFAGAQFQSVTHPNFYFIDEEIFFDPNTGLETHQIIKPIKDNISSIEVKVTRPLMQDVVFSFTENLPTGEYLFYENSLNGQTPLFGNNNTTLFFALDIIMPFDPDDDETFFTYSISYSIDTPDGTDIISGSCDFYIDVTDGISYRPIQGGVHSVVGTAGSVNGVHLTGDMITAETEIYLFDLQGRMVYKGNMQPNWQQTIMPDLKSGLYIYQIHNGGDIQVGKVIKQ